MTSTEITPSMGAFDQRDGQLVRYLGLNPDSPADRAAVAVCREYGFDPLLKHVVVIPKGGVYITRDGLLHVAHRSGQLDGIVVEQDPTLDGDEWVARVSVWRKDMRHPFTYPGRYPVSGGNRAYAPEMALKAAEAHALRRAFSITGLPTLDERRPDVEPRPVQSRVTVAELTRDTKPAGAAAPDPDETTGAVAGAGSVEGDGSGLSPDATTSPPQSDDAGYDWPPSDEVAGA